MKKLLAIALLVVLVATAVISSIPRSDSGSIKRGVRAGTERLLEQNEHARRMGW